MVAILTLSRGLGTQILSRYHGRVVLTQDLSHQISSLFLKVSFLFDPLLQMELANSSSSSVLHCSFKHWDQTCLLLFEILAGVSSFFTRRNGILSRWRSQVFGTELPSKKFTLGGAFPHISRYCCIDSDLFSL